MAAVNTSIPEAQQDFKKERALFRAYSRTKTIPNWTKYFQLSSFVTEIDLTEI